MTGDLSMSAVFEDPHSPDRVNILPLRRGLHRDAVWPERTTVLLHSPNRKPNNQLCQRCERFNLDPDGFPSSSNKSISRYGEVQVPRFGVLLYRWQARERGYGVLSKRNPGTFDVEPQGPDESPESGHVEGP